MYDTHINLLIVILILLTILIIISYGRNNNSNNQCKLTPNRYNYVPRPNVPLTSLLSQNINYMNLSEFDKNIANGRKEKFSSVNNYSETDNKSGRKMTLSKGDEFEVPRYNMIECEGPNCSDNMTGPYPLPCGDRGDKSVFIKCGNTCGDNKNDKSIKSLDDIDPETLKILLMNKYITTGLEVIDRQ
jgi:hypothetical protein